VSSCWRHSSRTVTTSSTMRLSIRNEGPVNGWELWHRNRRMQRTWVMKWSLTRNTGLLSLHIIISRLTVAVTPSELSRINPVSCLFVYVFVRFLTFSWSSLPWTCINPQICTQSMLYCFKVVIDVFVNICSRLFDSLTYAGKFAYFDMMASQKQPWLVSNIVSAVVWH